MKSYIYLRLLITYTRIEPDDNAQHTDVYTGPHKMAIFFHIITKIIPYTPNPNTRPAAITRIHEVTEKARAFTPIAKLENSIGRGTTVDRLYLCSMVSSNRIIGKWISEDRHYKQDGTGYTIPKVYMKDLIKTLKQTSDIYTVWLIRLISHFDHLAYFLVQVHLYVYESCYNVQPLPNYLRPWVLDELKSYHEIPNTDGEIFTSTIPLQMLEKIRDTVNVFERYSRSIVRTHVLNHCESPQAYLKEI